MDEGLDTGPIIKVGYTEIFYPHVTTFSFAHAKVEAEMVAGLYLLWDKILDRTYQTQYNDPLAGNYFSLKQFNEIKWVLDPDKGWHTPIRKAKERYEDSRRRK